MLFQMPLSLGGCQLRCFGMCRKKAAAYKELLQREERHSNLGSTVAQMELQKAVGVSGRLQLQLKLRSCMWCRTFPSSAWAHLTRRRHHACLHNLQSWMVLKDLLMLQGKGRKRKVSQKGEPPAYKWKQQRKK